MAILLVSRSGDAFPLAWRMQEAGEDVTVFVAERAAAGLFDGMLRTRLSTAMGFQHWISNADPATTTVLFDSWIPPREEASEPAAESDDASPGGLVREFATVLKQGSGKLADWFRARGFRVIGASVATEKIESNLMRGRAIAAALEAELPQHAVVDHGPKAVAGVLRRLDRFAGSRVALRPIQRGAFETFIEDHPGALRARLEADLHPELADCDAMLEEVIAGPAWSETAWWDGATFSMRTATLDLPGGVSMTWARNHSTTRFEALADTVRRSGYLGPVVASYRIDAARGPVWMGCRFGLRRSDGIAFFTRLLRGGGTSMARFLREIRCGVEDGHYCVSIPVALAGGPRPGIPVLEIASPGFIARDVREGPRGCETAGIDRDFGTVTGLDDSPSFALARALDAFEKTRVAGSLECKVDREALDNAWKLIRDSHLHV